MSSYNWLSGSLSDASSWGPQADPSNPVEPGNSDTVTISGSGTLTGEVDPSQATVSGTFDLTGTINSVDESELTSGTLTIESGAVFGGGGIEARARSRKPKHPRFGIVEETWP